MLPATGFKAMDPFVCIWTELLFLDITIFEVRGALGSPGHMGKPMTIKIYETTVSISSQGGF